MSKADDGELQERLQWIWFGMKILLYVFAAGCAVTLILVTLILYCVKHPASSCTVKPVDTPLYSLRLDDTVKGSFFLGTGSVNGQMNYYAYVEKQGGKILQTFDAKTTIVKELENVTPVYRTYVQAEETCTGGQRSAHQCMVMEDGCILDELIVPNGTVRQEYSVG